MGWMGVCQIETHNNCPSVSTTVGRVLEIAPTPHPVIRPVFLKVHNHGSQKSKELILKYNSGSHFLFWKSQITTQKPLVLYQFFVWIPASGGSLILTLFFLKQNHERAIINKNQIHGQHP